MKPGRRNPDDGVTVRHLLDAASREFAKHGFAAARIRDIVDAAGANLAAVNYHFGGKQGLYEATVAKLLLRANNDLPADSLQSRIVAPEERLHAFARVMLERYLGGENPSATSLVVAHELLDPTPAVDAILRGATGPQWARLREIVAELLGPLATEEDVALASLSVEAQWLFFLYGRRMLEHQIPDIARDPGLVDKLAQHVAAFSIAAIGARRLQLEGEGAQATPAALPVPAKGGAKPAKSKVIAARLVRSARRERAK